MPKTVAVPVAVPVKVTEQLPADKMQLAALNDPPVVPADRVKVTVPVGVIAVPAAVSSVTVAVDRKSVVKGKKVDLGGRGIIKKKAVTVIVFEVVGLLPL